MDKIRQHLKTNTKLNLKQSVMQKDSGEAILVADLRGYCRCWAIIQQIDTRCTDFYIYSFKTLYAYDRVYHVSSELFRFICKINWIPSSSSAQTKCLKMPVFSLGNLHAPHFRFLILWDSQNIWSNKNFRRGGTKNALKMIVIIVMSNN